MATEQMEKQTIADEHLSHEVQVMTNKGQIDNLSAEGFNMASLDL
jgi:hypothetical protein